MYIFFNILLEKSINQIDENKLLSKIFLNSMSNYSIIEHYFSLFIYENDLDENEVDIDDYYDNKDFINFLKDKLNEKMDDIIYDLKDQINNNEILIYRAMVIKNKNYIDHLIKQGKHLGIYWTYDKYKAHPYWVENELGDNYIFYSKN